MNSPYTTQRSVDPGAVFSIKRILGTALFAFSVLLASAQTATNTCTYAVGNEYAVTANCSFQTFNKPTGFTAAMNPSGCSGSNNDDAWGWFTATSARTAITFDPSANHRPILHVFTGACGSLSQIACYNGGGNGRNAEVNIPTTTGVNYMIRIQRHATNDAMNGAICIRPALANDECATATVLPVLVNCFAQTFTNDRATISSNTPFPTCGGPFNSNTASDIWFRFTPVGSGEVVIETTAGTISDAVMQLYTGTCGSLTLVECDDDDGPGLMPEIDRSCDPLLVGQSYWLRVWGYGGDRGTFDICISEPSIFAPRFEDCVGAVFICNDQQINNNAEDFGCTQDLNSSNRGCLLGNERQGSWYTFTPSASGTIEFTITPSSAIDYDYALWGPEPAFACPPASTPVRCSWAYPPAVPTFPASTAFETGLRAGNADTSEPDSGPAVNGFTAPLNVVAGEIYILYIDNFDATGQAFALDWTLTNGCSLDCNILPVELLTFKAEANHHNVTLEWLTQTERNSSHYEVERSADGEHFTAIGIMPAAGQSVARIAYSWVDQDPLSGVGYYRLRQMDVDGTHTYSDVITAHYAKGISKLSIHPNPAQDRIFLEYDGTWHGPAEIIVMDAAGRRVEQFKVQLQDGTSTIGLQVFDLEAGCYVVKMLHGHGDKAAIGRFLKP